VSQIKLRLDERDILDLIGGKVLFRDESGSPRGTGTTFTNGGHPVEICLTKSAQAPLQVIIGVKTGGGYKVGGVWGPCPHCKAKTTYTSRITGQPPVVEIICDACQTVVSSTPLNMP
jgi:hypothetical protein